MFNNVVVGNNRKKKIGKGKISDDYLRSKHSEGDHFEPYYRKTRLFEKFEATSSHLF